jgi:dihydroorotase
MNALDKLEAFASFHGPDFYGLPRNQDQITLDKTDWIVPQSYPLGNDENLIPLLAGETLHWKLRTANDE